MVITFRWEVTVGIILGTGETIRLLRISFMSMYSSKFRMILLPFTCSDFIFGLAFTKTGGKLSLGPPVGGTMLAQPVIKGKRIRAWQTRKKIRSRFMCLSANLLE